MSETPAPQAQPDPRPLILVGMMGAGKTTIGRRLAARLARRFVDADRALEERCGVPITTIFELEGEPGFRRRERAMLDELVALPDVVLATGGGAVLDDDNRRLMRERGWVVYLKAAAPELWHRLRRDRGRPLLQTANPRERIAQLLAQREPLYEAVAHCTVTSVHQPVEELVEHIIDTLPESLRPAR